MKNTEEYELRRDGWTMLLDVPWEYERGPLHPDAEHPDDCDYELEIGTAAILIIYADDVPGEETIEPEIGTLTIELTEKERASFEEHLADRAAADAESRADR